MLPDNRRKLEANDDVVLQLFVAAYRFPARRIEAERIIKRRSLTVEADAHGMRSALCEFGRDWPRTHESLKFIAALSAFSALIETEGKGFQPNLRA